MQLLVKAGIAHQCFHSSGQGLPLAAGKNDKLFKVYFFDIGLLQRMLNLQLSAWVTSTLDVQYLGAVSEQLVSQEYIAYQNSTMPREIYYWQREKKGSNAEVDFLFTKNGLIVPVEVKSGTEGGMKSLHSFLSTHPHSEFGLKISQNIKDNDSDIKEISLYGIEDWLRD